MACAICPAEVAHTTATTGWAPSSRGARCDDLEGDPTVVISMPVLRQLLAASSGGSVLGDSGLMAAVPRIEICELGPEDVALLDDENAFEIAFEAALCDEDAR